MAVAAEPVAQGVGEKARKSTYETFLTFKLGEECYGVSVLSIREIIQHQKITPVPQMPDYVKGVINLRGKVIPVVDMRLRFQVGTDVMDDRTCIIVVQVNSDAKGQNMIGLIVDAVEEVLNIEQASIEEKPDVVGAVDSQFIAGIAKVKGEVKTLLYIDRIVSADIHL